MINYHISHHSQEQIAQLMSELKTERERFSDTGQL